MAEFYEVLKRAVEALPSNTGEARRAVYERARKALIAQLEGFQPPLTPSEITSQRLSLEEAIRKVEGEAARAALGFGTTSASRPPPPRPEPPAPRAEPPAPRPEPPAPRAESSSPITDAPTSRDEPRVTTETPPPLSSDDSSPEPVVNRTEDKPAADAPKVAMPSQAAPGDGPVVTPPRDKDEAPDLGALPGGPSLTGKRSEDTDGDIPGLPPFADTESEDEPKGFAGGAQRSKLPLFAGIAVAAVILIGSSALLYSQWDNLFSSSDSGAQQAEETTTEEPQPAAQAEVTERPSLTESPRPEKSDARIPQTGAVRDVSSGGVRAVPTQRVTAPSTTDNGALTPASPTDSASSDGTTTDTGTSTPAGQDQAAQTGETQTAAVQPSDPPADERPSDTAAGAVAQTAILYEEGESGANSGKAVRGQVVWTSETEGPISTVLARISIPDKSTELELTIRPNNEDGFPASHLVEMKFSGELSSSIRNVPGLIMKETEEVQGDALVGAAIKVTDGLFWIALSAEDKDLARNRNLLEGRDWVDIPLLYASGKRAILTLEKGVPGDSVVKTAFKSWQDN